MCIGASFRSTPKVNLDKFSVGQRIIAKVTEEGPWGYRKGQQATVVAAERDGYPYVRFSGGAEYYVSDKHFVFLADAEPLSVFGRISQRIRSLFGKK